MAVETFIWSPLVTANGTSTFRVRRAQFGDGYGQVTADGLNNKVRSYSLQFGGGNPLIDQIQAFLDARKGSQSFNWTPHGGIPGLFICTSYSRNHLAYNVSELSATFQEWFSP